MNEASEGRQERLEGLKQVIRGLHEGEAVDAVRSRLREVVRETSSEEIVAMEQQLIDEGMPASEVKRMCDLHAQVLREVLAEPAPVELPAGHPAAVMRQENRELEARVEAMRQVHQAVATPALPALPAEVLARWRGLLDELLELEKHYARKENLLFPALERRGISGPSQVMWGKDDDVRELLAALREALAEDAAAVDEWRLVAEQVGAPLLEQVAEMISKEERILLPMCLEKLEPAEWRAIAEESGRFGYCLVEAPPAFAPEAESASEGGSATATPTAGPNAHISLGAGALSPTQLRGIFAALPLDLTFVDADDRVAFFTEGERIFPRPRAAIGRKVQLCHPPKSMDVVTHILDDFKAGRQDQAAFWIDLGGRKVHIRYFAVRDEDSSYLGCLELSQDLSPLRALEGERRLLAYEAGEVE